MMDCVTLLNEEKNFATMAAKYTQEKCDVSIAYRHNSVVLSNCCLLLSLTYQRLQCVCALVCVVYSTRSTVLRWCKCASVRCVQLWQNGERRTTRRTTRTERRKKKKQVENERCLYGCLFQYWPANVKIRSFNRHFSFLSDPGQFRWNFSILSTFFLI